MGVLSTLPSNHETVASSQITPVANKRQPQPQVEQTIVDQIDPQLVSQSSREKRDNGMPRAPSTGLPKFRKANKSNGPPAVPKNVKAKNKKTFKLGNTKAKAKG